MGACEHCGALAPGTHEGSFGIEFQDGVIAAIEGKNCASRADRDATDAPYDGVGRIMEKVLHKMKSQLRDGCTGRALALRAPAFTLRIHRRHRPKRNRCGTYC